MTDKEEKLREALNEYFGRDVGDVKGYFIDPASPTDYVPECPVDHTKQITIITKPHKPTFEEKRKELVDQLDKELKEIDDGFEAGIGTNGINVLYYSGPFCQLYDTDTISLYSTYLKVKKTTKAIDAISRFSWELKRLKEKYDDETI